MKLFFNKALILTLVLFLSNTSKPSADHSKITLEIVSAFIISQNEIEVVVSQEVDVRDVSQAHVEAISNQESNYERFILCTSSFWLHEISQILINAGFTKAPTLRLPNFVVRFAALFSARARESVRMLGEPQFLSNEKVKTVLNWQPRPVEETIVETAKSLEGQDQISIS